MWPDHAPRVTMYHKVRLTKLTVQLPEGRRAVQETDPDADKVREFVSNFCHPYNGQSFNAAVQEVLWHLVAPKREYLTTKEREALRARQRGALPSCER